MNKFFLLVAASIIAGSSSVQTMSDAAFDPTAAVSRAADAAGKLMLISQVPPAPAAEAPGVGSYSDGYRMGMLSKFSVKGWVNKSGEGELLSGQDTPSPTAAPATAASISIPGASAATKRRGSDQRAGRPVRGGPLPSSRPEEPLGAQHLL